MENPETEWTIVERQTAVAGAETAEEEAASASPGAPVRQLYVGPRWSHQQGGAAMVRRGTPSQPVAMATAVRRVPSYNYRAVRIIRYVATVLEIVLAIRFFLRLLGASPDAVFSLLVYALTEAFVMPFEGLFPHPGHGTLAFDSATAVAIVIYPLVAWAVSSYIRIRTTRGRPLDPPEWAGDRRFRSDHGTSDPAE